jgi:hypothetical protein
VETESVCYPHIEKGGCNTYLLQDALREPHDFNAAPSPSKHMI